MFFAKIATKLFCLHYLLLWVQLSLFGGEPIKGHWSFIPPEPPKSPKVLDKDWVGNQIDKFILSKLEDKGLTPAKTASPSQLIRRIYYDLIGLPPEPAVVKKFIEEYSLDLYKKIIDDLLESPRYGERWGRHWLDVARYGDSNGGDENHAYPHAWRYRDYVIDAFNKDIPFNDFIKQQIAGDLLSAHPKDQSRNLTATGFLAIGTKILAEKDSVKKRADIVDEQIDTLSRSLMGISVSCARCHDHKFDPIPTADYYALAGIFNSTLIEDQVVEKDQVINVIAKKKSQIKINFNFFQKFKGLKIINIGRLTHQKNQIVLLKAFTKLVKIRRARLLLIGSGSDRQMLIKYINEKKLDDKIKIIPFTSNPFKYISLCDLKVLSSRYEGNPNILLETASLKKIIISSDCKVGPKEILQSGKGGILFKVGDYNKLYSILKNIELNSNDVNKKIMISYKYVKNNFQKDISNSFIDIIKTI